MCHPIFIPKYSRMQKIIGGISHIVLIGTTTMYEWMTGQTTWPGFFNSEEICANCGEAPGFKGCMRVKVDMYMSQYAEHSNNLQSVLLSE